jgi:uncharacterized protein YjeT (DUF2065 family)
VKDEMAAAFSLRSTPSAHRSSAVRPRQNPKEHPMKTSAARKLTDIAAYAMVAFNALFLTVNGIVMLIAPKAWYETVPGVTQTGFFNQHFVRDIGMIQMFLGLAFLFGLVAPGRRVDFWMAATIWLCGHALFHFREVAVGICAPTVIPRDFPAVTLPALLGILLCIWALRENRRAKSLPVPMRAS